MVPLLSRQNMVTHGGHQQPDLVKASSQVHLMKQNNHNTGMRTAVLSSAAPSEEQENFNSAHFITTPRYNSLTNSVNMLSLQKTTDIESRKNRIMADRD